MIAPENGDGRRSEKLRRPWLGEEERAAGAAGRYESKPV